MTDRIDAPHLVQDNLIEFHYQKSPHYRSVHVDGFYGGVTPRGYVAVSLFNERSPIPKHVVRRVIASDGKSLTAGKEEIIETLHGIVRQVETTMYMDLNTAREFQLWLARCVDELESLSGPKVAGNPKSKSKPK